MNTSKPFSTISYNSPKFLRAVLDDLVKARKLAFWAFIEHVAEEDETKDHIHLYMEPASRLQTVVLEQEFREYDPAHPDKPKKCIVCTSSKFGEWYMYVLHDPLYLSAKMESRKYHYKPEQVISSDPDTLREYVKRIDLSGMSPIKRLQQAQESGMTFNQAVAQGWVPLPQFTQYQKAWECLAQVRTYRAGRPGHEIEVNTETGEVIEGKEESKADG